MKSLFTWRRMAGIGLLLASLTLLIAGSIVGEPMLSLAGVVSGALFGCGLIAAVLQRVMVVMRLAAATRADMERALLLQENLPAVLRKGLAEQGGAYSAEISRAKSVLLAEIRNVAQVQAQHGAALAAAMENSVSRLRDQMASVAEIQVQHGAALAAARDQYSLELANVAEAQVQRSAEASAALQRLMTEGSTLCLRVYRDIRADLDARQAALDSLAAGLHEAISGQSIASRAIAEGVERVGTDVSAIGTAHESMSADVRAIGTSHESMIADVRAIGVAHDSISSAISDLSTNYERDKASLVAFSRDEPRLRSLSKLSMQWLKTETVREVEALLQLRQMLDIESSTPLLGGWAMDPEAVLSLVKSVLERKPERIVELGSGSSTLWLALALRKADAGRLVSYDHLDSYAEQTRRALREHGLEEWAEVRVAPLEPVSVDGTTYSWYAISPDAFDAPTDILIVDGPPGGTAPMARFPAVPLLRQTLAANALIVVDDALRPDEKKMMARWGEIFPDLSQGPQLGARTRSLVAEHPGSAAVFPSERDLANSA